MDTSTHEATPRTLAYLRVSTDQQDAENQRAEITAWASSHGLPSPTWTAEQASTAVHWESRLLGDMLANARRGDTLIVAEVSRLARSTIQALEVCESCAARGVSLHVVKSGLILDGSMSARIVVTVLALAAEIEREFIRARTRAALATRRAAGVKLGRPPGPAEHLALDGRGAEILHLLQHGVSKRAIARVLDCSPTTLYRWLGRQDAGQAAVSAPSKGAARQPTAEVNHDQ